MAPLSVVSAQADDHTDIRPSTAMFFPMSYELPVSGRTVYTGLISYAFGWDTVRAWAAACGPVHRKHRLRHSSACSGLSRPHRRPTACAPSSPSLAR